MAVLMSLGKNQSTFKNTARLSKTKRHFGEPMPVSLMPTYKDTTTVIGKGL